MEILKDFKNDLMSRREVKIVIETEKNPSIDESTKLVASEFKAPEENIVVDQIKGKFGRKTFLIVARIYDSKELKEKIEPKSKKKEGEGGEGATPEPAAPEPAAEKPEEKPAEEVKEESPKEDKTAEEKTE